jgi:5-formyltetrahydrofolate cyclo-ligase
MGDGCVRDSLTDDGLASDQLAGEKAVLRARMKALLRAVSADAESRAARGLALRDRLGSTEAWRRAGSVYLFLSLPDEVPTDALVRLALDQGKLLAIPRVEGDRMRFHRYGGEEAELRAGPFSIREPRPEAPLADPLEDSARGLRPLILLPALAFDAAGNRLGRGKGYYDRYLAELGLGGDGALGPSLIGLCYAEQLLPSLPAGKKDRPVATVLAV